MKAITLYQPWATLVVLGAKKIETRSWATKYRGPLAIHASKAFPGKLKLLMFKAPFFLALKKDPYFEEFRTLPTGCIVGMCDLVDCVRIDEFTPPFLSDWEIAFGDYTLGRFAWILKNPMRSALRPRAKGKLRLWEWERNHG